MRRSVKTKRETLPDYKYQSFLVSKLINKVMWGGKKTIAEKIVYGALSLAEKSLGKPAMEILGAAVENVGPQVELRSRRIGGANYQVPFEVKPDRRVTLALRWMVEAARSGKGKPMITKLHQEITNAFNNAGAAIKKRQDIHKMAEANKAFAHFAW